MNFKTEFVPITVDPDKIYDYSFAIIEEEMGEHHFSDEMASRASNYSCFSRF